jgi:lipid II:glycine glycyltransferase (peptidoglycan interpeptide bridge formation enzyme)
MFCKIETKEIEEIESTNILPQTGYWARVKENQGFIPTGYEITVSKDLLNPINKDDQRISDDLLVFIRYIDNNRCFAYVPYGPKLEPKFENQGVFLEELSEDLKPFLPANCIFIRYDLMWENQWAHEEQYFDTEGNWLTPPDDQTQEFRVNFNTHKWNLKKSPIDILPKNTFFLNLGKGEDEILGEMRFNTRYNIRRSINYGVKVNEYGMDYLDDWYRLYSDTAIRKKMTLHPKEYFATLLKQQQNGTNNNVSVKLLMADFQGELLSSMFLVLSHKRGIYLFGASSSEKRHLMASYALQWDAIKRAKKFGCSEYDMFGCAPNLNKNHPLYGVHVYKKGFGGNLYHRMGCWDYPYQNNDYNMIKAREYGSQMRQV